MKSDYFKRIIDATLVDWSRENGRKPLLLRGARQVGKTEAVRELGKSFNHYVEINFDNDTGAANYFQDNLEPDELCKRLSVYVRFYIVGLRDNYGN
jgi:predicted AAA+ superfamily ATPase